ncbi:MAG: hypothetical protein Q8Q54_18380 [Methylococcales bacterium]|nr:hypothetical protein [Methylococcales bacterium]MDP3840886.1 hypothetical protein [Methylococcales bacterium]
MKKLLILFCLLTLVSCAELPPKNADNVCAIFKEKEQWYDDAKQAEQRWGVPVAVLMAIMHQESHFVADAKPPRTWLLGFIPWFRPSSAFGYAQALDGTWDNYLDSAGSFGADRDDFADAVDFIGWYNHNSHAKLGIPTQDAKLLYFAYYEGIEGYSNKSHFKKADLQKTATKVATRARLFQNQLSQCQMN